MPIDTACTAASPRPTGQTQFGSRMLGFTPSFVVTESAGIVRLELSRVAHGQGTSLQEAADDLVRRLLTLALAFRAHGFTASRELSPDLEAVDFIAELAEFAAAGGDIRERVFG
jgi:hypothetical protein